MMRQFTLVAVLALGGCGDDSPEQCSNGAESAGDSRRCWNATVLALTGDENIIPPTARVLEIASVLTPADEVACQLRYVTASYEFGDPRQLTVIVQDATIASAWNEGRVATGLVDVDQVFDGNGAFRVTQLADGSVYVVEFATPVNFRAIAAQAAGIEELEVLLEPSESTGTDLVLSETPSGWDLTYSLGWGDCPSGCLYLHEWRVHVSIDLEATLRGEEGDPLLPTEECPGP